MKIASRNRSGFTLIEILLSLTVLVIGLVGILALFPVGMHSSKSAVQDSTSSILAESVKGAVMKSFRLAPPMDPNAPVAIRFYHDGVPRGLAFTPPILTNEMWVPADVAYTPPTDKPRFAITVGDDFNFPNDLAAIDSGEGEEGDRGQQANPFNQYSYKFMLKKAAPGSVENLYLVVIYIYRNYNDAFANGGKGNDGNDSKQTNQPKNLVNVFSTMVSSN